MNERYELPEIYKNQLKEQQTKINQLKDLIRRLKIAGIDVTQDEIKLLDAEAKLKRMMDAFEVK